MISGRDALHRLDNLAAGAREQFDAAVSASDSFSRRRSDLGRMKADGYRQLAAMRLDVIKDSAAQQLSAADSEAQRLLEQHERFLATIDGDVEKAGQELAAAEAKRREAEAESDQALHAYEVLTSEVQRDIQTDPSYVSLKQKFDDARAIAARAEQKAELARADRTDKGAPYEKDPLFSYLWQRKFRTPDYRGGGLTRLLDGWVAKLCHYDEAYLNFARLTELPDRLAEHVANMKLEAAETQAAIEHYEAAKMEERGSAPLQAKLDEAKAKLKALDADMAAAEKKHSDLRMSQQKAATGDAGPREQARRVIEEGLAKASFPDLRVLAAQTTTQDDDRLVDLLIKLRTEELQMEVNWRNVDALPARRRQGADALEKVRQRFKEAGLDSPYVLLLRSAYEAALQAYGGPEPDGEKLWKAILATVRQAPMDDDDYFGGRRRGRSIGLPGVIAGVVLGELIRGATRGGRWGGGYYDGHGGVESGPGVDWSSGGSGGGSFGGGGSHGGGSFGGGGFHSGGGFGGGGFHSGGKF